jgi:hypothetical protein
VLQRRIAFERSEIDLEFIAHAQIGNVQHGGEHTVELRRLQLILAPENFERRILKDVDRLTVAIDLDLMDDRSAAGRIPGDRDIAELERVGLQYLQAGTGILRLVLAAQVDDDVLPTGEDRPGHICWNGQ